MSGANRQHVAALATFIALAVAMTWPLAPNLRHAVAHPGDPYINTWILDWDWYATLHRPLSLFDANIFYPARYALAYSENLFGIALLLFPFRAAGVGPITAHNLAILGGFLFSGFSAYLLARFVSGSAIAAISAGIFYAFVPFRFTHLPHVQHVWGGTLPLMLVALLWYSRKPTWGRATIFAAAFLFNGLCNIHWLLFGSIAVAVTVAILRPRIVPLAACSAIAALLLIGFLWPYREVAKLYGMQRSWDETMTFSARPADWLVSNFHNRLYAPLRNPKVDPERWLFPGALSLILGVVAVAKGERKTVAIAVTWIFLGFFGSLGLHTIFHRFLFGYVPGFRAIRVPARWAAIAYVGLAILIALAAATIAGRRIWIHLLIAAALVFELRSAPIRWYIALTETPAVERWVAENRPRAVIELPMNGFEYATMLHATAHHQPIVNGISGFGPPEYVRVATLASQWSDELIPELKHLGVSHVIIHGDAFDDSGRAWLSRAIAGGRLAFVSRFDGGIFGDWLFAIDGRSAVSSELQAMLQGKPTFSETTFGLMDSPHPEETMTGSTVVSGFAFSPYGIREVNLLVNNGAIRLATELREDPALKRQFPWYDATVRPRFVARFPQRPRGIWKFTDMQPEIIDGRGKRTLLEDRWINWP